MPGQLSAASVLLAASTLAGASKNHGTTQTKKLTAVSQAAMTSSRRDG